VGLRAVWVRIYTEGCLEMNKSNKITDTDWFWVCVFVAVILIGSMA